MVIINEEYPHYVMDIGYFFSLKDRLQIIYPLQFTKVNRKYMKKKIPTLKGQTPIYP